MPDKQSIINKLAELAERLINEEKILAEGRAICLTPEVRADRINLLYNILDLLEAHESRVMPLEEVKELEHDTVVWFEHTGIHGSRPGIIHYTNSEFVVFTDGGKWHYQADGYGSCWRCWTSHPTDEQREAVKWDD